jgi:hypothetical protein
MKRKKIKIEIPKRETFIKAEKMEITTPLKEVPTPDSQEVKKTTPTPSPRLHFKLTPPVTPSSTTSVPQPSVTSLGPTKEEVKKIGAKLLSDLMSHNYSHFFIGPVSVVDFPDYDEIIKRRMDFTMLKSMLSEGVIIIFC